MIVLGLDAETGGEHEAQRRKRAQPRLQVLGIEPELHDLEERFVGRVGDGSFLRQPRRLVQRGEHPGGIRLSSIEQVALRQPAELLCGLPIVGVAVGDESGDRGVVGRAVVGALNELGELRDQAGQVGGLHAGEFEHGRAIAGHSGAFRTVAHRP